MAQVMPCSTQHCNSEAVVKSRKLCRKHYNAWYRVNKNGPTPEPAERDCATCGVAFTPKNSLGKYCSKPCVDKGKPSAAGLTCYICGGSMVKGRTSKPQGEAAHNKCRVGTVPNHGLSGYNRGCRCDTCREAKNADMRRYNAERATRDGVSYSTAAKRKKRGVDPNATVDCTICKMPLINVRSSAAKFPMHKACKDAAPEWLRRGLPNPKVKAFEKRMDKAAEGTTGGNRVFTAGGCDWCGDYFVAAGAKARFCSPKCKTQESFQRRSAGGTFKISAKRRKEIYERDGWMCKLCSHPVDKSLPYTDIWSATLDHIIPQALQLVPDHSSANLRLAHRWCNSARGDGSNMTNVSLIKRASDMHMAEAA